MQTGDNTTYITLVSSYHLISTQNGAGAASERTSASTQTRLTSITSSLRKIVVLIWFLIPNRISSGIPKR